METDCRKQKVNTADPIMGGGRILIYWNGKIVWVIENISPYLAEYV